MPSRRSVSACVGLWVGLWIALPSAADAQLPRSFCWRAAPARTCQSFAITEIGVTYPVTTSRGVPDLHHGEARDFQPALRWQLGVMRNTDSSTAHGVVLGLAAYQNRDADPSLEWRRRQWLDRGAFFDLSAGYTMKQLIEPAPVPPATTRARGHGVTLAAAAGPNEWVSVTARGDVVRGKGRTASSLALGVRSGGLGGVGLTGAVALVVAAIIVAAYGG